jgi:hypothetical protein
MSVKSKDDEHPEVMILRVFRVAELLSNTHSDKE